MRKDDTTKGGFGCLKPRPFCVSVVVAIIAWASIALKCDLSALETVGLACICFFGWMAYFLLCFTLDSFINEISKQNKHLKEK